MLKKCVALLVFLQAGLAVFAQQITVTGHVTDSHGEPVAWADVYQKGTQNGTATDDNGYYSITVSSGDAVLVASFIGYQNSELAVDGKTVLDFVLQSDAEMLDNAVVIGYGTARREDLTGSVASISPENFDNKVIFSVDDALKGGVAGLMVSSTSGQPGAATKMLIRGASSLSGSTGPLIVVDGFPLNGVNTSSGMGMGNLDSQMSGLAMINPEDIASIEVLKDASSTAIYGNRGANGVIMITTKKGRGSSGRIQYNGYVSMQMLPRKLEMLDFKGYATMMNELNPMYDMFSDTDGNLRNFDFDRIKSIDWQDRLYRTGLIHNHNLSIQNSTDKTNFLISASFMQNESIIVSTNWTKFTAKANIDHSFTDKFRLGVDINYSRIIDDGVPTSGGEGTAIGTVMSALVSQPFDLTDPDTQAYFRRAGVKQYQIDSYNTSNKQNPVTMANDIDMLKILNRTIVNAYMEYDILDDLKIRVTGGLDNYSLEDKQFYPTSTPRGYLYNSQACMANISTFGWLNENTITWSPVFGRHKLNLMAGLTEQGSRYYYTATDASSFENETLGFNNLQMATDFNSYSNTSTTAMMSMIFRGHYSYDDRYIGTFTFRRDGTSSFVKNKWGSFYSGAFAWNAKQEEFLKYVNTVSTLRLRLSVGEVGNSSVPTSGSFAQLYNTNTAFGTDLSIGQSPLTLANEDLTWEKTLEYNVGLELGLWNERLHVDLDLYNKTTRDLLLEAPVLNISGYTKAWQNIGSIRNMGAELSLSAVLIDNHDFTWSMNANLTRNVSKILKLGQNGAPIYLGITCLNGQNAVILREGGSVGELFGYRAIGLYQLDEFDAAPSPTDPDETVYTLKPGIPAQGGEQPGSLKLWDKDGSGKIDDSDREVIGNFLPDVYGAFSTTFNYKAFNLYLGFQYSIGNDLYNANYSMTAAYTGDGSNQMAYWNKRWTTENQSSRYYSQVPDGLVSSAFVEDASYLRFATARLTYTLPARVLRRTKHIESCRFYVSADNIYVFTKYSGYDPEVGISQNSAAAILSQGFDYGNFPKARTFTFGVNISFK